MGGAHTARGLIRQERLQERTCYGVGNRPARLAPGALCVTRRSFWLQTAKLALCHLDGRVVVESKAIERLEE